MMINTTTQLNDFAKKAGVKTREQLLPELIKSKELVSANIAQLVSEAKLGVIVCYNRE